MYIKIAENAVFSGGSTEGDTQKEEGGSDEQRDDEINPECGGGTNTEEQENEHADLEEASTLHLEEEANMQDSLLGELCLTYKIKHS